MPENIEFKTKILYVATLNSHLQIGFYLSYRPAILDYSFQLRSNTHGQVSVSSSLTNALDDESLNGLCGKRAFDACACSLFVSGDTAIIAVFLSFFLGRARRIGLAAASTAQQSTKEVRRVTSIPKLPCSVTVENGLSPNVHLSIYNGLVLTFVEFVLVRYVACVDRVAQHA